MSEVKQIDTKRLLKDFNNLRNDWKRGLDNKKIEKKYRNLRDVSESLYRVATREEKQMDKILLNKLMSVIENRQIGTMTKREAEESFGNSLGEVYINPIKDALSDED